jgi:cobalt/nickel transport system permease protein
MTGHYHGRSRGGFIEQTVDGLHAVLEGALYADHAASGQGFLQRLDPRVKVLGLTALISISATAARLWVVAAVLALAVILGATSFLPLRVLATRIWSATLIFSAALAVPALFLTPGVVILNLPVLHWGITSQGFTSAAFLVLRAEAAATLALVLVHTTPWMHVLKALRMCRVPVVFIVILGMTCRYILLLLETAHEMFESRKSRTVGSLTRNEQRRVAILTTGALFGRTLQLSNEVYLAMQARGFRGEVYILDDFHMQTLDWFTLITFGGLATALVWAGH